ncbi:unnamed protein product [Camellia sinensis]
MSLFRVSRASLRLRRLHQPLSLSHSIFHPIFPSSPPISIPNPNPNPSHDVFDSPIKPPYTRISSSEIFRESFKFKFKFEFIDLNSRSIPGQCAFISTSSGVAEKEGPKDNGANVASWIDLYLPEQARPYARLARLDKPIGTWLLAWPCFWSITLAAPTGNLPDIKMLALFGCGALLLRGAGCTINDLIDRDIDTKVERTKLRPVASGVLTPFQGLCFLGFQLLLGLGILLQLNNYRPSSGGFFLAAGLLLSTHEEVDILGLTFNWGALLGWSAIKGSLDPAVVFPLYISGVFWTLVYDTIYAHQDKEDDLKVGVKSTALRFGDSTKEWVTGFGIACISSLALSGFNANIGWPFYACLTAASGQLAWQILTVDLSCRDACNRKWNLSQINGLVLLFSAGSYLEDLHHDGLLEPQKLCCCPDRKDYSRQLVNSEVIFQRII